MKRLERRPTFVIELRRVPRGDVASLVRALRSAAGVQSVEAPYNGTQLGLVADTSFVVFENEKQQESLGARTAVLGVDQSFDPARDYYVNFHDLNPNAPRVIIILKYHTDLLSSILLERS